MPVSGSVMHPASPISTIGGPDLGDFPSNRDEMFDHSQFIYAAPSLLRIGLGRDGFHSYPDSSVKTERFFVGRSHVSCNGTGYALTAERRFAVIVRLGVLFCGQWYEYHVTHSCVRKPVQNERHVFWFAQGWLALIA